LQYLKICCVAWHLCVSVPAAPNVHGAAAFLLYASPEVRLLDSAEWPLLVVANFALLRGLVTERPIEARNRQKQQNGERASRAASSSTRSSPLPPPHGSSCRTAALPGRRRGRGLLPWPLTPVGETARHLATCSRPESGSIFFRCEMTDIGEGAQASTSRSSPPNPNRSHSQVNCAMRF